MNSQILIVDDEEMVRDLLVSALQTEDYVCHTAADVDHAFEILSGTAIDLVISDIMMPGRSGIDFLRDLKQIAPDIAVLMITGLSDITTAMECIRLGAADYITKPFSMTRIILTVRNLVLKRNLEIEKKDYQISLESKVQEQTGQIRHAMDELRQSYTSTLTALVKALDAREKEVGSHSERVMNFTILMAEKTGIGGNDLEELARGALLHDIGKIGISDNILLKPGALDDGEWLEMRRHPQIGHAILSGIEFLRVPSDIIRGHHERFDGSGYPNRLSGEQISVGARIFALVDTLDAMTSDRPYRSALPFDAVTREVGKFRGSQFDPDLADLFLSIARKEWEECACKHFL